jgi:hypothetical protein
VLDFVIEKSEFGSSPGLFVLILVLDLAASLPFVQPGPASSLLRRVLPKSAVRVRFPVQSCC